MKLYLNVICVCGMPIISQNYVDNKQQLWDFIFKFLLFRKHEFMIFVYSFSYCRQRHVVLGIDRRSMVT